MNLLKRRLAPILPAAWDEIDDEARNVLRLHLGGRKLVDFDGPHGWDYSSIQLGRLDLLDTQPEEDVHLGRRRVLSLSEFRIPIQLDLMELDTVARGGEDPDLDPVVKAAEKAARVEDRAIFLGLPELDITGIIPTSPHEPIDLPSDPTAYPAALAAAEQTLRAAGIDGPYGLALGSEPYRELYQAADDGYPIRKRVEQLLGGPIVWSPVLEDAVLMSVRGGDFTLTVGQDLAIGYAYHDRVQVELYLTESFTFRVLEPAAAVALSS